MGNHVNVITVQRPTKTFWEKSYIPEIARGLGVTITHFFRNLQPDKSKHTTFTIMYPESGVGHYAERFRGRHRLMLREDGQARCVACMCCSTICPADCIHIEAAEYDDPNIEKYPKVFVIDELRCIVCGLCVEACPCDAIRMDTGIHMTPHIDRTQAFHLRDDLMQRGGLSMAVQGGERKA
jgi:NADH-quinone oxidoreductase subunit I